VSHQIGEVDLLGVLRVQRHFGNDMARVIVVEQDVLRAVHEKLADVSDAELGSAEMGQHESSRVLLCYRCLSAD
jgi:hypothetical protein